MFTSFRLPFLALKLVLGHGVSSQRPPPSVGRWVLFYADTKRTPANRGHLPAAGSMFVEAEAVVRIYWSVADYQPDVPASEACVPSSTSLVGFVTAALILLVIPGPAVLYIVARSISQGRGAGLISVLGISAGGFVHIIAATAGLSAILLASATAFSIVKLLGAGYLIYLGVRMLLAPRAGASVEAPDHRSLRRLFTDGFLVSILNPKTALFFLAFLPQFVEPSRGPVPQQVLLLGLVFLVLAFVSDSTYVLLASSVRHWFGGRVVQGSWPRYLSGSLYIGLGISTALVGRRHS